MRLIFRGLLILALFGVLGSIYVREKIIIMLKERTVARTSVIYSRVFSLYRGMHAEGVNLPLRLKRAGYLEVDGRPTSPGQFSTSTNEIWVFQRSFPLPNSELQPEALVQISISEDGKFNQIYDHRFSSELEKLVVEPEILSSLGSRESRATELKRLEDFPPHLVEAITSIEDERFQYHFGVDPLAIGRAAVANFQSGKIVQGGSTITQQLAKNLFLTRERSIKRKAFEAIYAVLIETAFNKEQILELYMNEIFLGQEGLTAIHGFGEAASSFFGKPVEDLTIAEAATLAGIIKGPSAYSPRRYPERAAKRRNLVLAKMNELGLITEGELREAKKAKIDTIPPKRSRRAAPYFASFVENSFRTSKVQINSYDATLGVFSTLDGKYQYCADEAIKSTPKNTEVALVAVDPLGGEIRAYIGGRSFSKSQFDRASKAKRQPGSLFKPIVYLTALDGSLNNYRVARTTSLLDDKPLNMKVIGTGEWQPENYDRRFRGEVTVREALYKSLNVPTINLAMKVGLNQIIQTAKVLGIKQRLSAVPSIALGALEATPIEMAQVYQTIANNGLRVPLRSIVSVTDQQHKDILKVYPYSETQVVDPAAAYVLTDMLKDVFKRGTAASHRRLGYNYRPSAGKTGTSNDTKDSWFGGYTPELLAVVWVGNDANKKTGLTGASGALPIWVQFMNCALDGVPESDFLVPGNVVFRKVDLNSGLLMEDWCPGAEPSSEVFVEGTEPLSYCDGSKRSSKVPVKKKKFWNNLWN